MISTVIAHLFNLIPRFALSGLHKSGDKRAPGPTQIGESGLHWNHRTQVDKLPNVGRVASVKIASILSGLLRSTLKERIYILELKTMH